MSPMALDEEEKMPRLLIAVMFVLFAAGCAQDYTKEIAWMPGPQ